MKTGPNIHRSSTLIEIRLLATSSKVNLLGTSRSLSGKWRIAWWKFGLYLSQPMWCVYHYPAFKFICHSWSNSFQQIMTMSINWTRASLQENRSLSQKITRSTKVVNSYTLPKKFLCCLHSDNTVTTVNSRPTILRSAFQPPQRLVGTEKWSLNPKQSNAASNESLQTWNSFWKGLSVAKSLRKYQQRGKLLQWQVHLSLKRLETSVSLVKASLNVGYMFVLLFPILQTHGV